MKKYALLAAASLALSGRFATGVCPDAVCDSSMAHDAILPIAPSPLAYAYLSEASYIDPEQESGSWAFKKTDKNQHVLDKLEDSNWVLADFVRREESGYVGSVWVNSNEKQVVLAHRGSADITTYDGARSWATDLRSVVLEKSSDFVNHAIEMLHNDAFLAYREAGFRPSITGHSLGGFLAQTCVAHSYVRGGEFDSTYYPGMSAVVFDSPGAADFIDSYIRSNLESDKTRLPNEFNIMNFCVSPTVVSTFGRHYGVIYQFIAGKTREWASVVMDHKLGERIRPNLELAKEEGEHWTSSCLLVAQWPQVELPKGVVGVVSAGGEAVTKSVFWLINAIWKKAKHMVTGDVSATVAESALGSSGNSVVRYFLASSNDDDDRQYERSIKKYMTEKHRLYPDEYTRLRMGSELLDRLVYQFMQSIQSANKAIAGCDTDLGWNKHLKETYGEHFNVTALSLQRSGNREELVLDIEKSTFSNVFEAIESTQRSLMAHGTVSFNNYLVQKIHNTASLSEENREAIQAQQDYLIYESAVSDAVGAVAKVLILDTDDSRKHRLDVIAHARNRSIVLNSALAKAPNSTSMVVKMDQSGDVGDVQESLARECLSNTQRKPENNAEAEETERDAAGQPGKK